MRRLLTALLVVAVAGCGGSDSGDGTDRKPQAKAKRAEQRDRARLESAQRVAEPARVCLTKAGYKVIGGSPRLDDRNAPDYELVLTGHGGGAFIAFYKQIARAKRFEPGIKKNARQFRGASVERHGAITIVWVRLTGPTTRARVRACLSV